MTLCLFQKTHSAPCAADVLVAESIDITDSVCPLTFVRVKLKLETMPPGTTLQIRLNAGEPLENLPRTLQEEGCRIVSLTSDSDAFLLVVEKQ